ELTVSFNFCSSLFLARLPRKARFTATFLLPLVASRFPPYNCHVLTNRLPERLHHSMKQKLTTARVARAKPDPKIKNNPTFYWDTELGNFALAVAPKGRKTYCIQYRANHVSRRMTIGKADRLTVDEARKLARKLLSQVDHGGDPVVEKRRKIDAEK